MIFLSQKMNLKILIVLIFALLVLTDALFFRRRRRRCPTCAKCPVCVTQQAQECVNVCHCVVSKKHKWSSMNNHWMICFPLHIALVTQPKRSIEEDLLPCQFEYFDSDKDLFINKAEFILKVEEHNIFDKSEIEIMYKILDKNEDGEISMEEFQFGKRTLYILEMMIKCREN
ncbi:hypothetical protein KUTeg_019669 [Tegillarca granosa]|uniref:EF-hand domain-containing protein n=1 Tax=Tegillarca granosa TaxID=220873 RepID=A0ABQ9ED84_TEGGR|nr:hypothetical protein KUTeg_019669 [Tegillarca granosa]